MTKGVDPRIALMLGEAFRHAKPIGGWGDAHNALAAAGCNSNAPGVVVGEEPSAVFDQVSDLLASHRVWERFPATAA
jgi:catalase